jgi:hypothetical protein
MIFEKTYQDWERWAEEERPARSAMKIFEKFYELYGDIGRESERIELMLGNGCLRWLISEGIINHPILLQRVELEFDLNVPEFRVVDSDGPPEFYTRLLPAGDIVHGEYQETPSDSSPTNDPVIVCDPVLFVRSRSFGLFAAFDRVLQDLEGTPDIPISISRIVGIETKQVSSSLGSKSTLWNESLAWKIHIHEKPNS